MPAGWKGGLPWCCTAPLDSFTLAVCSVGDGLYHAVRVDPGSGAMQYNSPLLVRDIPAHRIRDGAFWFVALKAALFPDSKHSAALFYEQLLPYLNQRPLASNVSAATVDASGHMKLGDGVALHWLVAEADASATSSPLAAVAALQLAADESSGAPIPPPPGGPADPLAAPTAAAAWPPRATRPTASRCCFSTSCC